MQCFVLEAVCPDFIESFRDVSECNCGGGAFGACAVGDGFVEGCQCCVCASEFAEPVLVWVMQLFVI